MMNIKSLAVAHVLVKLPTKGRSLMYKMIYVIKISTNEYRRVKNLQIQGNAYYYVRIL